MYATSAPRNNQAPADAFGGQFHVAAVVAYDGTEYFGFQYQTDVPTIQGTLEKALEAFVGTAQRVSGAGRTDTGVHARGQVISVRVPWRHGPDALQRAWNAHLPPSIVVRRLCAVAEAFHPRFSAQSRTYRYTVYQDVNQVAEQRLTRSPLTDRFSLFEPHRLDVDAMGQAAQMLLGQHDFRTFGQPPQGENTVRQITQFDVQVVTTDLPGLDAQTGYFVVFTITANAFLRQMVRNLVGTLLEVGRGQWQATDVQSALQARNRSHCAVPAPARGLVLEKVSYPDYPDLFA